MPVAVNEAADDDNVLIVFCNTFCAVPPVMAMPCVLPPLLLKLFIVFEEKVCVPLLLTMPRKTEPLPVMFVIVLPDTAAEPLPLTVSISQLLPIPVILLKVLF